MYPTRSVHIRGTYKQKLLSLSSNSATLIFPFTGQFWNIPVTVEQFTYAGAPNPYFLEEELYAITLHPAGATQRTFVAELYDQTWDYSREICLYAGSIQGGPVREITEPNDSVIQGSYKDYSVASLFGTDFVYSQFNISLCA